MRKLFIAVLAMLLLTIPASAQTKKKRVADKKFWIAAAVIVAASALDVESTVYWQKACPTCREVNSWLYGKRPSRKRMYLTLGAISAAEIAGMWWVKRDDQQQGTKVWLVVPIAHTAGHGGAAWYNYSRNYPAKQTCPALGAGCTP
jgi:hypothetical protein